MMTPGAAHACAAQAIIRAARGRASARTETASSAGPLDKSSIHNHGIFRACNSRPLDAAGLRGPGLRGPSRVAEDSSGGIPANASALRQPSLWTEDGWTEDSEPIQQEPELQYPRMRYVTPSEVTIRRDRRRPETREALLVSRFAAAYASRGRRPASGGLPPDRTAHTTGVFSAGGRGKKWQPGGAPHFARRNPQKRRPTGAVL
jgi:hypothetical protein